MIIGIKFGIWDFGPDSNRERISDFFEEPSLRELMMVSMPHE